jgi:quercetin 2,3-dioxygenase
MQLIASPDGDNGSLQLHQDARLYHATLIEGESSTLGGLKGRTLYLHVIGGTIEVEARTLHEGDGATLTSLDTLVIHSASGGEALLFDLP